MLDIIDQMRVSIPDEIKKAQQLLAQRDRILAQAQEEANRTVALAREKGDKLVEKDPVTQAAQARADQIIAQARLESEKPSAKPMIMCCKASVCCRRKLKKSSPR